VRSHLSSLVFASLLWANPVFATEIGQPAPPFSGVLDEKGAKHALKDHKKQVLVLIVWSSRCNHSKRYAARLVALARRYLPPPKKRAKVAFLGIAPNKHETRKIVALAKKAARLPWPILLDVKGVLTRRLKAFSTPTVFVFDRTGKLRYRGAIDDDPRGKKKKPVSHLRLAIDAILAGKAPPKAKTGGPGFKIHF
jgi:peroxiredoxin